MNYFDWIDAVVSGLLDEAIRSEAHPLEAGERQSWAGNRAIVSKDAEDQAREETKSELGSSVDPGTTYWMATQEMSGKSDASRLKGHPDQMNTGAHLAHTRAENGLGIYGVRLFISPSQARGQIGRGRITPVHLAKGSDLVIGRPRVNPSESYAMATKLANSVAKLGNPELSAARTHGLAGQRLSSPYHSLLHIGSEEGMSALQTSEGDIEKASEHLTQAHKDWFERSDAITRRRALGAAGRSFARHLGSLGLHGTVHAEPAGERFYQGDDFSKPGRMRAIHAPVHTVSLQDRIHVAGDPITKESEIY